MHPAPRCLINGRRVSHAGYRLTLHADEHPALVGSFLRLAESLYNNDDDSVDRRRKSTFDWTAFWTRSSFFSLVHVQQLGDFNNSISSLWGPWYGGAVTTTTVATSRTAGCGRNEMACHPRAINRKGKLVRRRTACCSTCFLIRNFRLDWCSCC